MYYYKELGLENTRAMFEKAYREGYAVPALNFVSIEQFNAIMDACGEKQSPVILLASPNLHRQLGYEMLARISQSGADRLKHEGRRVPVALHLDHGMTYEQCVAAVESGFSSVMIDGSALPFEENIALTKKVVEYAHAHDVTVEGELGVLSGAEEEGHAGSQESQYTDPSMVEEFVNRTGVDCLAISIGTCHGLVKLKPNPDGSLPELRYDILADIGQRLPGFPIVLHGASSVVPSFVKMINENGGNMPDAIGIPEEMLRQAASMSVCKINIDSDLRLAMTGTIRKYFAEHPEHFDPRQYLKPARDAIREMVKHKIVNVLGSNGKA